MAWTTHPTVVVGQTWSASDQNTYVKGNLDTLWPYTAAQQVAYSTSTTTVNKASAGSAYAFLRSNLDNTSIEFGSIVVKRVGNSSASWSSGAVSTSNSTYTPTNTLIQAGAVITSTAFTATVTFPITYLIPPLVFINYASTGGGGFVYPSAISTASFTLNDAGSTVSGVTCTWISLGEK